LGDFKASASSFERGLKLEPGNPGLKSCLQNSQAKIASDDTSLPNESNTAPGPNPAAGFGGMADMMRNMGMGPGGGMPDIASMMNNPQLMAMAQQMASNGGLANLMQNPRVTEMVSCSCDVPTITLLTWTLTDEPCTASSRSHHARSVRRRHYCPLLFNVNRPFP
jgi:small glutamine-rich tetratricopeptide repeat-containing protein alpha